MFKAKDKLITDLNRLGFQKVHYFCKPGSPHFPLVNIGVNNALCGKFYFNIPVVRLRNIMYKVPREDLPRIALSDDYVASTLAKIILSSGIEL